MTLDDCQLILFSLPLVSVNDFPASEKKKKSVVCQTRNGTLSFSQSWRSLLLNPASRRLGDIRWGKLVHEGIRESAAALPMRNKQFLTRSYRGSFRDITTLNCVLSDMSTALWNRGLLPVIFYVTTRIEFHIQELLRSDKRPNYQ